MGQNSVGDLEKDVNAVVDSLVDHFQLASKTMPILKSFVDVIMGLVKKYAAQAEQRQFEEDCKVMCPYCRGFRTYKTEPQANVAGAGIYVHYGERRSSDGVRLSANCSADALRRAWEERHDED